MNGMQFNVLSPASIASGVLHSCSLRGPLDTSLAEPDRSLTETDGSRSAPVTAAEPVIRVGRSVKMNSSTAVTTAITARVPQTRVDTTRSHFAKLLRPSDADLVLVLAVLVILAAVLENVEGFVVTAFEYMIIIEI